MKLKELLEQLQIHTQKHPEILEDEVICYNPKEGETLNIAGVCTDDTPILIFINK